MEEDYYVDREDDMRTHEEDARQRCDDGTRAIDERGHGECCDECRRSCKRQFWTELLKTVAKVAGVVLAAFGLQSFNAED